MGYADRLDAGKQLAKVLGRYKSGSTVVLALPRGGVVLGAVVAKALEAPLGVVLVRKIGHPNYPEYAIGAIAEDENPVFNDNETAVIDEQWLKQAESSAKQLIANRRDLYYGHDFEPPVITDKTVIIVDDGIATGLTMVAAVKAIKNKYPKRIIVAVPVAPSDSIETLEELADEVVVLDKPEYFLGAVGSYYRTFNQIEDEEVISLLREVHDDIRQHSSANR